MKKKDYVAMRSNLKVVRKKHMGSRNLTCSVAALNSDGRLIHASFGYCHAMLRRDRWPQLKDPIALYNQVQDPLAGEDVMRRYFEWLFNYSPFRHAFISKSVKRVMSDQMMIANTEATGNYLTGALIATRLVTENYNGNGNFRSGSLWDELVRRGVHPTVAFCASQEFKPTKKYDGLQRFGMGHGSIATGYDYTVSNMLHDKPRDDLGPWRKVLTYHSTNGLWNYQTRKTVPLIRTLDGVVNKMKDNAKGDGKNPFAKGLREEAVDGGWAKSLLLPFNETVEEMSLALKNMLVNKENVNG